MAKEDSVGRQPHVKIQELEAPLNITPVAAVSSPPSEIASSPPSRATPGAAASSPPLEIASSPPFTPAAESDLECACADDGVWFFGGPDGLWYLQEYRSQVLAGRAPLPPSFRFPAASPPPVFAAGRGAALLKLFSES
jgi:hypothetical protein